MGKRKATTAARGVKAGTKSAGKGAAKAGGAAKRAGGGKVAGTRAKASARGKSPVASRVVAERAVVAERIVAETFVMGDTLERAKRVLGVGASNLPALGVHTIERAEELAAIHDALRPKKGVAAGALRAAALTGAGGSGKSTLALAYAHARAKEYPGGRFVVACEAGNLVGEMAGLARFFALAEGVEKEEDRAAAVRDAMQSGPATLLILDNVNDAEQWSEPRFRGLLPGGNARVLATTRASGLADAEAVKVGRLSVKQGAALLAGFRKDAGAKGNAGAVGRIVERVEGLAVAMASVGAYMKLNPEAEWAAYAEELDEGSPEMLDAADGRVASQIGYARPIVKALDDAIDALSPVERRAMEYGALLGADMIPGPWLGSLLENDPSISLESKPGVKLPPAEIVVRRLMQLDLLRPSAADGPMLAMHRLHRARLRERINTAEGAPGARLLAGIHQCISGRLPEVINAARDPSVHWELVPTGALAISFHDLGFPVAGASLANAIFPALHELGAFALAHDVLTRALGGPGGVQIVDDTILLSLSYLAVITSELGHMNEAGSLLREAITFSLPAQDSWPGPISKLHHDLAMWHKDRREFPIAIETMQRAIALGERAWGSDGGNLSSYWNNLSTIQFNAGAFAAAAFSAQRSIDIMRHAGIADEVMLVARYSLLEFMHHQDKNEEGAAEAMRRVVDIAERNPDSTEPELAKALQNLAIRRMMQGEHESAERFMRRAIWIDETNLGPVHYGLVTRYRHLAHVLNAAKRRDEARGAAEHALGIARETLGDEHPDTQVASADVGRYDADA